MAALVRDRRGGSAILVGLAAPAILGGLALSMDVGLWYLEKRKLQQISDTASLGAVSVLRSGGSIEMAKRVAINDAKRNGYVEDGNTTLTVNVPPTEGPYAGDANAVEVIASRKLPLLFSGYMISEGKTIQARSVALHSSATAGSNPGPKNIELALILDVSTSMSQASEIPGMTKLQAVQASAKKVVDVVVQSNQDPYTTRVAVVPYGSSVAVGDEYFTLVSGVKSSSSDVVERTGVAAFTDDAPGPGRYFPGYDSLTKKTLKNTADEKQHKVRSVLAPLSNNKVSLNAKIDSFIADGTTAGHIGLAWAWNALSPKWSSVWSADSTPGAYDADKTMKIAVLMSDFDLTVTYAKQIGTATDQAMNLCTRMKQAGIIIYTVGYRVPAGNMTAKQLWTGCASDPDKVYTAETAEQLIAAFSTIASAVSGQGATVSPKLVE